MKVSYFNTGNIMSIETDVFTVPFTHHQGIFVEKNGEKRDIQIRRNGDVFEATYEDVVFTLFYETGNEYLKINVKIENKKNVDFDYNIGFHMGIDSYMERYPQWHEAFFPTMLRCEKTHLWGYYMNTAENALAVATAEPVGSYDIVYNRLPDGHYGHRICGTDILFFTNTRLPERHPQNFKVLKGKSVYTNEIYLIPVVKKKDIADSLYNIVGIPVIQAEKYTYEKGENLHFTLNGAFDYKKELYLPDGTVIDDTDISLDKFGTYKLRIVAENGKECEALFCCRKDWDFYLENAAREAMEKPQKATTHVESFYGLFSCFLAEKYFVDEKLNKKAYECFEEIMPYMFDFFDFSPKVIPGRIQNTALLISLLTDMYEAKPKENLKYLSYASKFGDWLMKKQDHQGVFRNGDNQHYTCVIYIAKSMLELALAEKNCHDRELHERYAVHYESVKKAVDELVRDLDNIDTEGETTLEDGMISCAALQIGMFALTLPEEERKLYIDAAEYLMKVHSCLEQQLIPDCRMNGASLRYWESQYDVMIRANMLNSPHGWTAWTAYAHYYLYLLTGKKKYLLSLMNILGSCVQLMDFTGKLRWGFCAQPYVKARTLVPDYESEVKDGYTFVDLESKAYRGKYEVKEYSEEYVDMISGWYRTGEEKVTGGYSFCPLFLKDQVIYDIDNQGGCCDNDVHEIFKCVEETVFRKAFIYENEDGSFLTFGCKAEKQGDKLIVYTNKNTEDISYNLRGKYTVYTKQGYV